MMSHGHNPIRDSLTRACAVATTVALLLAPGRAKGITPLIPTPNNFNTSKAVSNSPQRIGTATITAFCHTTVIPSTVITKTADLHFHSGSAGAPPETITTQDHANAAAVKLNGNPNQAYSLVLPHSVLLTNQEDGDKTTSILVKNFTLSLPPSGVILPGAWQSPYIGATRDYIPATLKSGNYSGSFSLTVIYP